MHYSILIFVNKGYGRYYNALKVALEREFPGEITVIGLQDRGTSGNFEVTIEETGEVIHSKKLKNQGKCETAAEKQAIFDKINAFKNSNA